MAPEGAARDRERAAQSVGVNADARCNARCAHCCVSSSPRASGRLDDGEVDRVLSQALALDEVREIGFTGGEPLLRRRRLLGLVGRVVGAGRSATVVTNGFWAVTPAAAARTVDELRGAGLRSLTISFDDFHAPHVPVARVRHALEALAPTDVRVLLNMAVTRRHTSVGLLESLGDAVLGVPVTRYPVVPAGQAASVPDEDLYRHPLGEKDLRCPGFQLIYHHDGWVYPCCSPAVFDTRLRLGRVGEADVEGFARRIERNLLLSVVRHEGFGWFLRRLARLGDPVPGVRDPVVSACEVCLRLFRDDVVVSLLRDDVLAYRPGRGDGA